MTAANQKRLGELYAIPHEKLTARQRLQRIGLHNLWIQWLDDFIDGLNRNEPVSLPSEPEKSVSGLR